MAVRYVCLTALLAAFAAGAQEPITILVPDRVFDGERIHDDWVVAVEGESIAYAGAAGGFDGNGTTVELAGKTLLPGLIEGHSHILLHPYNETSWNDQVLVESDAERVMRAVNHARASLMAGVTTMRDLGSEGAGYADVGVRDSIAAGYRGWSSPARRGSGNCGNRQLRSERVS